MSEADDLFDELRAEHAKVLRVEEQRDELLEALRKLVRRSDNGDSIEPGWYEIEDARAAIEKVEK